MVLRDVEDRWAASRPVWNQHAYAVTHVTDTGRVPRTSQVVPNWRDPALNNFRQNVQGGLEALGEPDLTAGGAAGGGALHGRAALIQARVCNRGTLPMVSGTEVVFYRGADRGPLPCSTPIPVALAVGECFVVACDADLGADVVDVFVRVDPASVTTECHENNNTTLYRNVGCGRVRE